MNDNIKGVNKIIHIIFEPHFWNQDNTILWFDKIDLISFKKVYIKFL